MTDETKEGFVKLKMPTYYIAKHSDEDLRAAVLAEREACAKAMQPMLRDMISRSQAAEIIRGRTE
jgi:hypothetical protein